MWTPGAKKGQFSAKMGPFCKLIVRIPGSNFRHFLLVLSTSIGCLYVHKKFELPTLNSKGTMGPESQKSILL